MKKYWHFHTDTLIMYLKKSEWGVCFFLLPYLYQSTEMYKVETDDKSIRNGIGEDGQGPTNSKEEIKRKWLETQVFSILLLYMQLLLPNTIYLCIWRICAIREVTIIWGFFSATVRVSALFNCVGGTTQSSGQIQIDWSDKSLFREKWMSSVTVMNEKDDAGMLWNNTLD